VVRSREEKEPFELRGEEDVLRRVEVDRLEEYLVGAGGGTGGIGIGRGRARVGDVVGGSNRGIGMLEGIGQESGREGRVVRVSSSPSSVVCSLARLEGFKDRLADSRLRLRGPVQQTFQ
jgi:hypothetical protein